VLRWLLSCSVLVFVALPILAFQVVVQHNGFYIMLVDTIGLH
jgi:hypothetical protein